MRVELPPGYVPPEPTHPSYGYLTPQERAEFEAEKRARLGIVPAASEAVPRVGGGKTTAEFAPPLPPPAVEMAPEAGLEVALEVEEATVAHTGWVPAPPPEEPVAAAATLGEFRWDARAQQWVTDPP